MYHYLLLPTTPSYLDHEVMGVFNVFDDATAELARSQGYTVVDDAAVIPKELWIYYYKEVGHLDDPFTVGPIPVPNGLEIDFGITPSTKKALDSIDPVVSALIKLACAYGRYDLPKADAAIAELRARFGTP